MSLEVDIRKTFKGFSLDISFSNDGECLGILGASGCGKSMTLKCIAGIMTPDEGRIVLNGKVLFDSAARINLTPQERKVGYLFQNYALFPNMTVRRNIGIGLPEKSERDKREKVDEMIRVFHLEGLEDRYPSQLSGGQQQRVALARIIAYEPDLLMLDEPFAALDTFLKEQLQFEVQKVLKRYDGDVLMVTHSRDEVYRFCDSAVIMMDGQKVDDGRTKELFYHPRKLTTARLSGCKNFSRARKLTENTLWAEDWNVELETSETVSDAVTMVGIRAHDFIPAKEAGGRNFFSAVPADVSEGPFEVSIRMMVNGNPSEDEDKYVWWKVEAPEWNSRWKEHFPGGFTVLPEKVMALE